MRLNGEDQEKFLSVGVATEELMGKYGEPYMEGFEDGYYHAHSIRPMNREYFEEYERGFTDGQVLAQEE